jgi:hypothetical protein
MASKSMAVVLIVLITGVLVTYGIVVQGNHPGDTDPTLERQAIVHERNVTEPSQWVEWWPEGMGNVTFSLTLSGVEQGSQIGVAIGPDASGFDWCCPYRDEAVIVKAGYPQTIGPMPPWAITSPHWNQENYRNESAFEVSVSRLFVHEPVAGWILNIRISFMP